MQRTHGQAGEEASLVNAPNRRQKDPARRRRKYAVLRAWMKDQSEQASTMTPAERAEEERAWQRFKHSINSAGAGYREVVVD